MFLFHCNVPQCKKEKKYIDMYKFTEHPNLLNSHQLQRNSWGLFDLAISCTYSCLGEGHPLSHYVKELTCFDGSPEFKGVVL